MNVRFLNAGECCVTVSFGNEVSIELNTRVRMLKEELERNPIDGVLETVPTYCALSVHYDPCLIRRKKLEEELSKSIIKMRPVKTTDKDIKVVPVYYGGETGPDLEYCAELEGISPDELIRKHSEHEYYVYQLGFSPGHPYMARAEEPFSFKRRETPRVDIPAHSVVVQTNLTNITPFHQPSGWNIIGSTPLNITDFHRDKPFFFEAGDRVKIKPVSKAEYDGILSEEERISLDNKEKFKAEEKRVTLDLDNIEKLKPGNGTIGFRIERPGALTTIQDEGRFYYQAGGVSPAGPMDMRAFYLANILVGNHKGEAALEITMIGPEIHFTKDTFIAITGADLSPELNGTKLNMYQTIPVRCGDVLSFGRRISGCRAYIAFAGGIKENKVLGSCATDIKNSLGGHDGRALKAGDEIILGDGQNTKLKSLPAETYDSKEIVLRVVLGPQEDRFTSRGIRSFLNYASVVTDKSDRQGIRLDHEPLEFVTDGNIISDGIPMGAVQVANDGKPMILLADRQSVGGYAKIATVIHADLPKLAQVTAGCRIRFIAVGVELAEELYIREMQFIKELEDGYVQS